MGLADEKFKQRFELETQKKSIFWQEKGIAFSAAVEWSTIPTLTDPIVSKCEMIMRSFSTRLNDYFMNKDNANYSLAYKAFTSSVDGIVIHHKEGSESEYKLELKDKKIHFYGNLQNFQFSNVTSATQISLKDSIEALL